jgi:hypothetical protein
MMVYCIYLGICIHGSVYIILNKFVLHNIENVMLVFSLVVLHRQGKELP